MRRIHKKAVEKSSISFAFMHFPKTYLPIPEPMPIKVEFCIGYFAHKLKTLEQLAINSHCLNHS